MTLAFKSSEKFSIGVELELQLVNTHDYNLTTDAADLLRRVKGRLPAGELKPEVTQSMVEINSSVHHRHGDLVGELVSVRDMLAKEARRMNVAIAGGGAHPFQKWNERRIYPAERFLNVSEQYGYLTKQFTVFGQHIHIGCANGDDALYLCHALAGFMPQFIALSASSPFYQGVDTAFDCSRLNVVSAFPLSGTVPFVHTWADFEAYVARMMEFGIVKSMKDFYWDIRPKPEYGTIEIRVCDTPLTVEKAADLAAYAQALASWLLTERPAKLSPDIYLVYSYNRFQACRYGLQGNVFDPLGRGHQTIAESILQTVGNIERHGEEMGAGEAIDRIARAAAGGQNDARWLRDTLAEVGSLSNTVRLQSELWMG
ncbi:MAG: YbdK family carboxylate-amine ligase [Sulfuricella sp.]|nr:YbdK family carboxylate-amine ligase [Sulfuricella sp.]